MKKNLTRKQQAGSNCKNLALLRKRPYWGFFWLYCFWLAIQIGFATGAHASTLPTGFSETRLAAGLNPTGLEFAPDGRVFVTIKSGSIRVIKNGVLLATPFVTIPNVDVYNERGLLSVTFDPNFATNNYVYVYYTLEVTS
jgi:glucose/arabinose dehydrogenase